MRPSIPENLTAGRAGVPGLYVLFQDGMATVTDPEVIRLLTTHPQYGDTFTAVKEEEEALLAGKPSVAEPEHDISNVEYGHVGRAQNPKKGSGLTPEMRKFLTEEAAKIAVEIVKEQNKAAKEKAAKGKSATVKAEVETEQDETPANSSK